MTGIALDHAAAWRVGCAHFGFGGTCPRPRGMLVGEAPGPNTDPGLPLFPSTGSAARLMGYAGVAVEDWLGKLVRVNLCDGPWSARRAVSGLARVLEHLLDVSNFHDGEPLRVLLLGARVARVWGCRGSFGHRVELFRGDADHHVSVAWIPHPSGRNLAYNGRRNQLRARRAVLWALGDREEP